MILETDLLFIEVQTYKLGDWKLQCGQSIPNAEIAFKTFGNPESPAIIYPSWYSGCEIPNIPSKAELTVPSYCR